MSAPPRPSGGFGVVADQLRALASSFEDLEGMAAGLAGRVGEIAVSPARTGRCCPEAADALSGGLQKLAGNVDGLRNRVMDGHAALRSAARTYDEADATASEGLTGAGAEL